MAALTTEQKGQIAVLKIMIEAAKKGVTVLTPTTPERYDLVLYLNGKFYRTQVKYADSKTPNSANSIRLDLKKRHNRLYSQDEIDVILVYIPQVDRVCWLSPEEFHNRSGVCFRLKPAKNGQKIRCRLVEDYYW